MKYGDQLEQESVPEWSLHNVDYNALKHEIKVHTTRDQAAAIAIPGQHDPALQKFEDRLFGELSRQHDRVDLFVGSKADEISRRLESIASQSKRVISKHSRNGGSRKTIKTQRKIAKYERELLRCEEDILALSRFINAQVIAFRKITKKHKKWTGSSALGVRFRETVLTNPKSFTRRDLTQLQNRYEETLSMLREATPQFSEPSSPSTAEHSSPKIPAGHRQHEGRDQAFPPGFDALPLPKSQATCYWNEYDYGSDGDGTSPNDAYTLYINPEVGSDGFPGLGPVKAVLSRPLDLAKSWFSRHERVSDPSRRGLIRHHYQDANAGPGTTIGYAYGGISPFGAETDEEADYASSEDNIPSSGYARYYAALPSVQDQRVERYRERVLTLGTAGAFVASFVLLGIASLLIVTGRHKLRVEVDAGVTVGAVASLFCACLALGMVLYRKETLSFAYTAAVWACFLTACLLNGMLLVLVVGN